MLFGVFVAVALIPSYSDKYDQILEREGYFRTTQSARSLHPGEENSAAQQLNCTFAANATLLCQVHSLNAGPLPMYEARGRT